jgi:uncharacterized damage-inducible protein DinB
MNPSQLITDYASGPQLLKGAVKGLSRDQLLARPIAGKWSTLEVIAHIADFEIVGADRIKRTIAEDQPTLPDGDENLFATALAYHSRELEEELQVISSIRAQVTRILRTLKEDDFARIGVHSAAGPLTLAQYIQRGINHITHHIKFIEEKRKAL